MRELDFVDKHYKDKDLVLLKRLTLVIPTYNRNYYLSRCLWYHAHFPFGQIIVADSSPEEKKVVNRETVAKIREIFGMDVLYLEYQPETEKYGGDIYRKWGDAVQHVETEYSQIVTDKEFVIPTTCVECIGFLESHRDYGSADGEYYYAENITMEPDIAYHQYYLTKQTVDADNPLARYQNVTTTRNTHASTNLLALRRSTLHKQIYKRITEYDIFDLRFGEIVPEFLTIINAKLYHTSDKLFSCRDLTHGVQNGIYNKSDSSTGRFPNLTAYIDEGIFDEAFSRSIACLEEGLLSNDCSLNPDEIITILTKTLPPILEKRGLYGKWAVQRYQTSPLFSKVLFRALQISCKPPLRYLAIPLIEKKTGFNLTNKANKYSMELEIIEKIIRESSSYYEKDCPYFPNQNISG